MLVVPLLEEVARRIQQGLLSSTWAGGRLCPAQLKFETDATLKAFILRTGRCSSLSLDLDQQLTP